MIVPPGRCTSATTWDRFVPTLQDEADQFILIADLQALTDRMQAFALVRAVVLEIALDYLPVGIDPARSPLCVQSGIPVLSR